MTNTNRARQEQVSGIICKLSPEDLDTVAYCIGGLLYGRREDVEAILQLPAVEWHAAFVELRARIISDTRAYFERRQEFKDANHI